ncbi:GntR family transcriptional regulator [Methylocapsa sp. S129]|uniref:GntR family transcriptional regulator n=1 Tax=Methylocapsa sp. S129 TaxID=1641869 RepID=UPI00131D2EEA|nr:GntR family transcriptional regulator [Methylocapsa sp. S129]
MKTNAIFKRTYNSCLKLLSTEPIGDDLGSEPHLAARLDVSRTTIRAALAALSARDLIRVNGREKIIQRRPVPSDYYPEIETEPVSDIVEKRFMQWILHGDCKPGQQINSLELARQFGVSTSAIREYLNGFSQFGLLERRPSGSWIVKGFTKEFARELSEVRELFELRSVQRFVELPDSDAVWGSLDIINRDHLRLKEDVEKRHADFPALDERFHRLINNTSRNRFMVNFYALISMIFHSHYQLSRVDEKERHSVAIGEHLAYIAALQSRDKELAMAHCRAHLNTARATLLRSMDVNAPA